jgi:mono/diheme cytochrome c family protein
VRYLGWWLVAGALVAYGGYRWWEGSLPDTVLGLFRGDAPEMVALAATRWVALWALTVALALGLIFLVALPRAGRTAVAVLVALAAFTFFGSYERLREGARKPFLIHSHVFSNGLRVGDIARIDNQGLAAASGWVAARVGDGPEAYGRAVFKAECSGCHTLDGYQAIRPRLPSRADLLALAADDPPGSGERVFRKECASCHRDYTYEDMKGAAPSVQDIENDPEFTRDLLSTMVTGTLQKLRDMGDVYTGADHSHTIDTRQALYPFMPPMVGTQEDLEALAAYLLSLSEAEQGGAGGTETAQKGGEQ